MLYLLLSFLLSFKVKLLVHWLMVPLCNYPCAKNHFHRFYRNSNTPDLWFRMHPNVQALNDSKAEFLCGRYL